MNISKTVDGDKIVVSVEGWLDGVAAPEFREYMEPLLPCKELVLDFEKLEYVSSAGIREIVAIYRMQKGAESAFSIEKVSPEIMDIFEVTAITTRIKVIPA